MGKFIHGHERHLIRTTLLPCSVVNNCERNVVVFVSFGGVFSVVSVHVVSMGLFVVCEFSLFSRFVLCKRVQC